MVVIAQFLKSRIAVAAALVLITAMGFWLRFRVANHEYLSQWDEAYHVLVAENLISHPLTPTLIDNPVLGFDDNDWAHGHIFLHKPPMTLWLMAGSLAAFGKQSELAARIPSVVLGSLAPLITFLLARLLWQGNGVVAGLIAMLFHSLSPLFIRLVSGTVPSDHVDLTNAVFVELSIYLAALAANRESALMAAAGGVIGGVAYLTKTFPALIVFPVAAALFWGYRARMSAFKLMSYFSIAAAASALPWQIYSSRQWPQVSAREFSYSLEHVTTALEGHDEPASIFLQLIPAHYGGIEWIAYLLVLGGVVFGAVRFVRYREPAPGALLIWAVLPYLIFSIARMRMYSYVAPAVPAVLLLGVYPLVVLQTRKYFKAAAAFALLVVCLAVIPLAMERFRVNYDVCPWNVLYDSTGFRKTMVAIRDSVRKPIVLNVGDRKEIQAMFYTGGPAYPSIPSPDRVKQLLNEGYTVIVLLDALNTNQQQVEELVKAGLLGRVQFLRTFPPEQVARVSPYFN